MYLPFFIFYFNNIKNKSRREDNEGGNERIRRAAERIEKSGGDMIYNGWTPRIFYIIIYDHN